MKNRMNVEVIEYSKNKRNSFWFASNSEETAVAVVTDTKTGKKAKVLAVGRVAVEFEDSMVYYNRAAVEEAERRNYTDVDILNSNKVEFLYNNWFEVQLGIPDDMYSDNEVDCDIKDVIQLAKEILKENSK